jgi:hypothetical protein
MDKMYVEGDYISYHAETEGSFWLGVGESPCIVPPWIKALLIKYYFVTKGTHSPNFMEYEVPSLFHKSP